MKKSFTILSALMSLCLMGCIESNHESSLNTNSDVSSDVSQSQQTREGEKYSIVTPGSTKLSVGDTLNLECVSENGASLEGITWESSDPSVISITQEGRVKALTSGTSDITVKKDGVSSNPLTLTVEFIPVESIALTNAPKSISLGQKLTIETAISPSSANQNIELSSSSDALLLDSKAKTIEAIKLTDEEITVKAYASKDFSKFVEFKLKVNPLDESKKVTITFDTGSYAPLEKMTVTKGATIDKIVYDPFSNLTDKSKANDVVFFGFYYDSSFVKPVTFPFANTYSDMVLYAKFVNLGEGSQQYSWTYKLNEDENSYNVEGITTYITVGSDLAFGIPAYHEGKPVTSFNKIGKSDILNKVTHFALPNTLTSFPESAINYWEKLSYLYLPADMNITSIPKSAFKSLKKLTSIYLPDSVTSIGEGAFSSDTSLKSIHLPSSLKEVGESAFDNCESLEELDFKSVETIGNYAFMGTQSLKRVHFPANLKSISNVNVFMNSRAIERITVDSNNQFYSSDDFGSFYNKDKTIMYMAPNGRSSTNAYIPNTVKELFDNAFTGSQAEFIKVPSSVETIHYGVFGRSMNLKGVYLPTSVKTIKDNIFSMCDTNKLAIYVGYASAEIPAATKNSFGNLLSGWNSIWNQNSQYEDAGITTYETVYGFPEKDFVF